MISSISGLGAARATDFVKPAGPSAAAGATPAPDFSKVLSDVAGTALDAMKTSEATAIGGMSGSKSVQQVVTAMLNAEQALQTAVSVRDKLVSAYQEISRMQI